jgi:hypothetical protein
MRRIANWLLALPVPDPDLHCELVCRAVLLLWLAERVEHAG